MSRMQKHLDAIKRSNHGGAVREGKYLLFMLGLLAFVTISLFTEESRFKQGGLVLLGLLVLLLVYAAAWNLATVRHAIQIRPDGIAERDHQSSRGACRRRRRPAGTPTAPTTCGSC